MKQIVIGVDPHKLSATIEVVDQHERVLGSGRFATDKAGYAAMLGYVAQWSRGPGQWRAAMVPGTHLLSGWSLMASTLSTFRQSSRLGFGCWTPVMVARPTRTTRTRSQRLQCVPRSCGCCPRTRSWNHFG